MAVPEVGVLEVAVPEVGVLEVAVPEVAVPEVGVPEVAVPEVHVLEVTVPETASAFHPILDGLYLFLSSLKRERSNMIHVS